MIRDMLDPHKVKEVKRLISEAERIVLTCHVRPDGDAMGSTLGLATMLHILGKKARVITPDMPPRSLSFMPGMADVVPLSKYPDFAPKLIEEADLIFCCDYNKLSRLDTLASLIGSASCPKVLIDHHQQPDNFCDVTISFPHMSSTCELVFRLICALGYADIINSDVATCLAAGLITDTRNLSVNCNDHEIYLVLHQLLELGVDKQRIVREALETMTADAFRLRLHALNHNLVLLEDIHMAVITLSAEELKEFNYERGDTEGLVNEPLKITGICGSFFLREDEDCIKISARSTDKFPVSEVCEDLFNGGGHLQAAGGEFQGSLQQAKEKLLEVLPHYSAKYLKVKPKQ